METHLLGAYHKRLSILVASILTVSVYGYEDARPLEQECKWLRSAPCPVQLKRSSHGVTTGRRAVLYLSMHISSLRDEVTRNLQVIFYACPAMLTRVGAQSEGHEHAVETLEHASACNDKDRRGATGLPRWLPRTALSGRE